MGNIVISAFNATWLVEFYEKGFEMYTYDANEGDYIPSSVHHIGYMDWDFLHKLERNGFTTFES